MFIHHIIQLGNFPLDFIYFLSTISQTSPYVFIGGNKWYDELKVASPNIS